MNNVYRSMHYADRPSQVHAYAEFKSAQIRSCINPISMYPCNRQVEQK